MSHRKFFNSSPWASYNKKLISLIEHPMHGGSFTKEGAEVKGMRFFSCTLDGVWQLSLLIDESDGVIADAKFKLFGPSFLIGILEATCAYLIRKPCHILKRLSAEMIEKQLQDSSTNLPLPDEALSHLNAIIDLLEEIELGNLMTAVPSPLGGEVEQEGFIYPGWELLPKQEQMAILQEVIDAEIRPYIELDAGGIEMQDLKNNKELTIVYQGACTTCHSSTGATLNAIQSILRSKVHPEITVIPVL
ncbi:MAG: hypothetical protein RLZZ453_965 [Chlamydiota bacterium]|jgi:NifU-like protein